MTSSTQSELTPKRRQELWRREMRAKAEAAFAETPILVHTMGKVGSTAVYRSLRAAGYGMPTFHIHSLWPEHVANWRAFLEGDDVEVPLNLHQSEAVIEQLRLSPERAVKIISLIRDPLAREVSSLFENPNRARHVIGENQRFHVAKSINHLITQVSREAPCEDFFSWFPDQIERIFGIDILARPFDKERGWQVYREGRVELLLIRLEDLSRVGTEAVSGFLESEEPIEIVKSHVRTDKVYARVKREFQVPRTVCERIYAKPIMRHLYAPAQLEEMKDRWSDAGETREESERRVRAALLEDIDTRHRWAIRETASLKSDRAAAAERIESLLHENEQLRNRIETRQQPAGSVTSEETPAEIARRAESAPHATDRDVMLSAEEEARPAVIALSTTGSGTLRDWAGRIKRRVFTEGRRAS